MIFKLKTALLSLLCFAVSLTAPFVVPIALLFTPRDSKVLAFSWYGTPDEPDLYDLDMAGVKSVYDRYGHWMAAWYWFGWRNRAHGFESLFSQPATAHWPAWDGAEAGRFRSPDGFFLDATRYGSFIVLLGWQVYASKKYASGLEYRPKLSIKRRPLTA